MTNSFELSDLRVDVARRAGTSRTRIVPRRIKTSDEPVLGNSPSDARGNPVKLAPEHESVLAQPDELDRLYRSLAAITPDNHPRTARLLASSTRKVAQKIIEEAGEVAIEAVKHHRGGIVRESADLLYHLVVLWHRAGIDPKDLWTEMRSRADTLGIAEKLPKASGDNRCRSVRNVKPTPEGKGHD
jgi:phosphoribosyl-ATP pyrophosphohydrolase